MRAALFWTPQPNDPLSHTANMWLGRDAERNIACPQPAISGIDEATKAPRHYGFHATLRPPMRLLTNWQAFHATVEKLASTIEPFDLPPLEVAELDGFLVLRETAFCTALHALADACVRGTDLHRLPPSAAELARRRKTPLTPTQNAMLARWGYPYVMSQWRFHMTLTRRLVSAEMEILLPAAQTYFAEALAKTQRVEDIALFTQAGKAPFLIADRLALTRTS